jgi:hypothetical protein
MKRGEGLEGHAAAAARQRPGHGWILDDEQPGDQPIAELKEQGELAVGRETAGLDGEALLDPDDDARATPGIPHSPEGDQVAKRHEVVEDSGLAGPLVRVRASMGRGHREHDIVGEAVQQGLNVS